jgi:hypothetical protein
MLGPVIPDFTAPYFVPLEKTWWPLPPSGLVVPGEMHHPFIVNLVPSRVSNISGVSRQRMP